MSISGRQEASNRLYRISRDQGVIKKKKSITGPLSPGKHNKNTTESTLKRRRRREKDTLNKPEEN